MIRDEMPLPDVLKFKAPVKCMSAKTFKKQKAVILRQLRTRTDPPPRLMRAGTGAPSAWRANLCALLEQPTATAVRGFKLYKLPVDLCHWNEPAWIANVHVVVATVSESGTVVYKDPTACEDSPYIFVPSDRAHVDLTTEQLLSSDWHSGRVVGGDPRFCQAFILHEQVKGRQHSVIATRPEDLRAKRNVFVQFLPHFAEWYRERCDAVDGVDPETQAELMGMPVFNSALEATSRDACQREWMGLRNPEACCDGLLGVMLELQCRQQLMRGEINLQKARELFFAYFDSTATIVRATQAQRLIERLQANGFNTLYS
jgi:hypothetical protein